LKWANGRHEVKLRVLVVLLLLLFPHHALTFLSGSPALLASSFRFPVSLTSSIPDSLAFYLIPCLISLLPRC